MSNPVDQQQTQAGPKRRKSLPIWVIALVAALVLAGVGFGAYQVFFAEDTTATLECGSVNGTDDTAKLTIVDCDEKSAVFRVAVKKDKAETSCPEGAYRELRDEKNLICLMPNFIAGNCYESDDANQAFKIGSCDSPEAIKITKVIDGTTDPSGCPNSNGLGYPEPKTVFCIETPGVS
ncbi:LppU/SCO3897 family protein [Actinokineospora xionganensis]|uniref:Uncharacterized protein n=1 Tax=Actinokineospora xionganensis TaxID=2684470 RepID=A0ABR7L3B4_9PSEU|nr:hypothetical protein [Actinokineospora xionganensis]MBC6447178.1 hypothetical protein [Actinokineospora xionganensis]